MARLVECPKCGRDISGTYEPADPSVGIMSGSYYCDNCDLAVGYEPDDEPDEHLAYKAERYLYERKGYER